MCKCLLHKFFGVQREGLLSIFTLYYSHFFRELVV